MEQGTLIEKIQSLAKRRGFIFQGSEIYGGLGGTWDYGPLGVMLKNNIKESWRKKFVSSREDMYEVDAAILMNPKVWESSGHVAGFADPMTECSNCKGRFRVDQIPDVIEKKVFDQNTQCPSCQKRGTLSPARQFNMMFATKIGASEDTASTVYLRPETAQGIFSNFKNVMDSIHPKLPFGIAQIGKAFRNEITPRDFVFRVREFEQMEIEYFVREEDWKKHFEFYKDEMREWFQEIGVDGDKMVEVEIAPEDLAHYSKRTVDFEFVYPFGQKELCGLAYRTDFDLSAHQKGSGQSLVYVDDSSGEKIVPHVIEPSMGLDRAVLALLLSSYKEVEEGTDIRVYLDLKPSIAPVIACVSPLLKNKPELVEKAREVFGLLKNEFGRIVWDDNGNIGKRYRRQDEIGTPWCVVIDFDTKEDNTVTVRDRNTGIQERIAIDTLKAYIRGKMNL